MFIATNKISIPADQHQRMIEAFERSAPGLKQFEGFQSFEIWVNEQESTLLAVSHWESREAYNAYVNSDTFRRHHGGSSSQQMQPHASISYYTGKKFD